MKLFFGVLTASAVIFAVSAGAAVANPADLDATFDGDGRLFTDAGGDFDQINAVAVQPSDQKIVVAGMTEGSSFADVFAVARYNANGTLDSGFDGDSGSGNGIVKLDVAELANGSEARALTIQSDGKIVLAGFALDAAGFDTGEDFAAARLNTDGTLDDSTDITPVTSFGGDGVAVANFVAAPGIDDTQFDDDRAEAVAIDSLGRVILAGTGDPNDSAPVHDYGVVRFLADGNLDSTFDGPTDMPDYPGNGAVTKHISGGDFANDVVIDSGDKIVVVGQSFGGTTSFNTTGARFNTDGTLDTSFKPTRGGTIHYSFSTGPDFAEAVARQPDGKFVLAGTTFSDGNERLLVARLESDGDLDPTFNEVGWTRPGFSGAYDQSWQDVAIQPNGTIVTAGFAAVVDYDFAVARYLPNGKNDLSFSECDGGENYDMGSSETAEGLALQSNGRIVAGGGVNGNFGLLRLVGGSAAVPDCVAPNTTIAGPSRTRKRRPVFRLGSNEANVHFVCRIDGVVRRLPFKPCPAIFRTPRLSLGGHLIQAKAIDAAGNTDASQARKKVKILRKRRRR